MSYINMINIIATTKSFITNRKIHAMFNKKSRTYGTSDLSIHQLCYHMKGGDYEQIASGLGVDREWIGSGSLLYSLIGLERSHDFREGIL